MTTPTTKQPSRPPFRRPPPLVVEVRRVERVTPRMVRITVGGEQMAGFQTKGAAEHIRVYLPDEVTGELAMPSKGPDGNAFPPDGGQPPSRAYTPLRWNPDKLEMDIEFALHDGGLASGWAENVKAGDPAIISGRAGGAYFPDTSADWYVIGGDATALPAIGTLLDMLPSTMRAYVLAEVRDAGEEQALSSDAELEARWLHHLPGELPGRALADAMKAMELPRGKGRIWVSCEASIMREIRRHCLEERGLARSMLRTQGYWKAGAANHPDHDMGEDV